MLLGISSMGKIQKAAIEMRGITVIGRQQQHREKRLWENSLLYV
jgi:hypothetical protein